MKSYVRTIVWSCVFLAALSRVWAEAGAAAAPQVSAAALARWQDLRFGMFIHWGPVSLTGHEIGWSRGKETSIAVYDELYRQFNPTNYNADEWVSVAKAAGMKYLVLTTKHHDGFCLWDTKQSDYNIMNTPFRRDVVKELAAACKKQGLAFGTYYSVCDWHHPDFPLTSPGGKVRRETANLDRYEQYLRAQVSELLTNYGPLNVMWFDVPQEFSKERGQALIDFVRAQQPDILVNDRAGWGAPGDFSTPEQRVGKFQNDRPWETCMTICQQWAWKPDDAMKSLKECLQALVLCAGGDGNLLFNVGPTPDGVIEARQVARLKEMGAWLERNGESIYGTRGGPWQPTKAVASTRAGHNVYVHILRPPDGPVVLPDLPVKIKSARLLGGGKVKFKQAGGKLTLTIPADQVDPIDTIVRLELTTPAADLPILTLAPEIQAAASNVYQNRTAEFGAPQAFDNDPHTRWATDPGLKQAWITATFPKPLTIQRVRLEEGRDLERVQKFEFQYRDGDAWKTIFTGEKIGRWFQRGFTPVTAREFRLNILDATDGPTLNDIEFFEK